MPTTLPLLLVLLLSLGSAARPQGAGLPDLPPVRADSPRHELLFADRRPVSQEATAGGGELIDVVLPPGPDGTGTEKAELFQYQLPEGYSGRGPAHPLLVAYHGFGSSAGSVANQSILDERCHARGYLYLSVTGIDDKLFGSPVSQQNTEAAILWMLDQFHVDPDRIVMVGFSMGAGVVANFASRHRDPGGVMIAALGLVSASCDWTMTYQIGVPATRAIMEHPFNFGDSPDNAPFAYQAASTLHFDPDTYSFLFLPGELLPDLSMVANLGGTPVYTTWDLGDPVLQSRIVNPLLVDELAAQGTELVVRPVTGTVDPVTFQPAPHSWAVLDEDELLDFFAGKRVQRTPSRFRGRSGHDAPIAWLDVSRRISEAFGTTGGRVDPDQNTVFVRGLTNVAAVGLDLGGTAIDPQIPWRVVASTEDGQGLQLTIHGADAHPSYFVDDLGALVPAADVDPFSGEVNIELMGRASIAATSVVDPLWTGRLHSSPQPALVGQATQVLVDGPPGAARAWVVASLREEFTPVPGSVLTLSTAPPAMVGSLPLDDQGDARLDFDLPMNGTLIGQRILWQAVVVDASGTVVAVTNRWAMQIDI